MSRRQRDERGAVAVMVATISLALVLIAAFAVDLGVQRVARRDMQSLADIVALDLVRELDGERTVGVLSPLMPAFAQASLARNKLCGPTSAPEPCTTGELPDLDVMLGEVSATTGDFTEVTAADAIPTAVKVTSSTSVGFAFVPGRGGASRSAVANTDSGACFKVGSYGARINSSNSPLLKGLIESALGGSLNLSALSYQGLATANISLLRLATQLGFGSVDQLANSNVTLGQLFVAGAQVLTQDGDTANAAILSTIAANVGAHPPISVGNIISAASGGGAAETATINALDLVTGAAFVANGSSGIAIPNLAANLGLTGTGLTSSVEIIQSPQLACGKVGKAKASTAQVQVGVTGQLASVPSLPTSILGLTASATADSTALNIDLAKATGTLAKVVCGAATAASPEGIDVLVGSQVGSVSTLTQRLTVTGDLGTGVLGGLLGGLLGSILNVKVSGYVDLRISTPPVVETKTASLRIPNAPASYAIPVSTGSGSLGLNSASVTFTSYLDLKATGLLGLNITMSAAQINDLTSDIVSGLVSNVANPLVDRVNNSLLTPLSALLGLELGGADVYAIPRPRCAEPALRG